MNNNNIYTNDRILSKKDLIAPIISMVAFVMIVISSSYAYFSVGSKSVSQNLSANVQLPARCIASVSENKACSTSLSVAQMKPGSGGSTYSTAVCSNINITVNGNQGCYCSFYVYVNAVAATDFAAANYVTNSIAYAVNTDITGSFASGTNIAAGWSSTLIEYKIINVETTGTASTAEYKLYWKMRNLNVDQDKMSGRSYRGKLEITTPNCSMPSS